jgi:general secretion pathway protein B
MSYILEALKKSEQERAQGREQDLLRDPVATPPPPPAVRPWAVLGLSTALLAGGIAIGWWKPWEAAPPAARPPAPVAPAVPPPAPAPAAVRAEAPPAPAPAARAPAAPPAPPATRPETVPKVEERKAATRPAPAKELPTPPERVLALAELPAALREALPSLAIRGFVHSEDAVSRMVVINDRVLQEGDEVAPELRLERIDPEGIVLSFRGYRFIAPR